MTRPSSGDVCTAKSFLKVVLLGFGGYTCHFSVDLDKRLQGGILVAQDVALQEVRQNLGIIVLVQKLSVDTRAADMGSR